MIVEVEDVSVSLGGISVLSTVSLSVESGQLLGLIGPNGAGKTTLLRTVNRVVDPDAGSVSISGEEVGELSPREVSRRVATVPQDTNLSFDFTVRQVVAMGRHPHRGRFARGEDGSAVDRALERANVAGLADRGVTEVSGGEKQRVLLARALAQDTPLLLLDEPTASLDLNHQVKTLELLEGLVAAGKTAVAAVHDLDLAARYCDEIALLSEGRIVARGPPESVLRADPLGDAFDTSIVVARDPVTGTPGVTALSDSEIEEAGEPQDTPGDEDRPDPLEEGDARDSLGEGNTREPAGHPKAVDEDATRHVHVVPGNGSASEFLPDLVEAGFEVSVGVLREGSRDHEAAARLDCTVVSVPPFTQIQGEIERARTLARDADATLLPDVAVGPENEANLAVVAASDRPVLVRERPFEERNHAGAAARDRYDKIRERASVTDAAGVLAAVREACLAENRQETAV